MDLLEIGLLFKEARKRSCRTQAELAQALAMSRATLSALEGGRCEELGVRKLTALLETVGLDLVVGPRKTRPTLDDLRAERRNEKRPMIAWKGPQICDCHESAGLYHRLHRLRLVLIL